MERVSDAQEQKRKDDLDDWEDAHALDQRGEEARTAAKERRDEIKDDLVARFRGPSDDDSDDFDSEA